MVESPGTAPGSCIAFELLQRYMYIYILLFIVCQPLFGSGGRTRTSTINILPILITRLTAVRVYLFHHPRLRITSCLRPQSYVSCLCRHLLSGRNQISKTLQVLLLLCLCQKVQTIVLNMHHL